MKWHLNSNNDLRDVCKDDKLKIVKERSRKTLNKLVAKVLSAKDARLSSCFMCQVWEDSKIPLALSNNLRDENKQRQLHRNGMRHTTAPCQCTRMELQTINMEMKVAAIKTKAMKQRCNLVPLPQLHLCCPLLRLDKLYRSEAPCTERLHEDHDDQRQRIRNEYGLVHSKTACQVHDDYYLQEAADSEATVST